MSEIERARVQAAYDECYKIYSFYSEHRDTILSILRAELEREKNPLTWSERINQMTVEEKADVAVILSKRCARALKKESCPDLTCWQCFIEFLNSPYSEGETK